MIGCRKGGGLLLVTVFLLFQGCQKEPTMPKTIQGQSLAAVSGFAWEKLAGKRIFFGHPSVGYNIIDGMGVLLKEHPAIRLKIVDSDDPSFFDAPVFLHVKVGQNGDPGSKCDDCIGTLAP